MKNQGLPLSEPQPERSRLGKCIAAAAEMQPITSGINDQDCKTTFMFFCIRTSEEDSPVDCH